MGGGFEVEKNMKAVNRKAGFEYVLLERVECGVALTGAEAKSIRAGKVKLDGSYVKVMGGEVFILNMQVFPYEHEGQERDWGRARKLLLHRKEIESLEGKMKTGRLAAEATALYTKGRRGKLEIALARGKKLHEKREEIKKAEQAREAQAEVGRG